MIEYLCIDAYVYTQILMSKNVSVSVDVCVYVSYI